MCENWNARQATLQQLFKVTIFSMLPVFIATDQLHHTPRSAEIQPMSQQASAATRIYRGLVLDTCAPPVACPRCDNKSMQVTGSTKQ